MPDRRDDALVSLFRLIDKVTIAMLHLFLDDATPAQPVIGQFAIPLVVVVSNFAFREDLLRSFSFGPAFGASEFVRFAFRRRIIPGVEQLARITTLRCLLSLPLLHSFS